MGILAAMFLSRCPYRIPVLLALLTALSAPAGCTRAAAGSLGIMPGVLNDTGNRSLRRAIMHWGLEEFCKEFTHRGAPLILREGDPVVGRFFARTCNFQELDNGDVFVQFQGQGYTWTNASWRTSFDAGGSIQYNQDFLMDGSTMYAYFRTRTIAATNFKTIQIERGGAAATSAFGGAANQVAKQIVDQQLSRGFTVIRNSEGVVEFSLGMIEKGQHPARPFAVGDSKRAMLANERTEVHGAQLDFVGPFEVPSDGLALYLTAVVDGVPAVDLFVVRKDTGDVWMDQFIRQPGVPQLPAQQFPLMQDAAATRVQWTKTVPVAKGYYYVVIDNSAVVGTVAPPATSSGLLSGVLAAAPPAALVNLAVQLGDAP